MGEHMYSNSIQVQVQMFDAQLKFGFQTPEGMHEERTVILSPQHLKVLATMLSGAVEQYELQFGEINLPDATKAEYKIEEQK